MRLLKTCRKTAGCWSILLIALAAQAAAQQQPPPPGPQPAPAPAKPIPVDQWLAKLQTLGAEYPKGRTQAMTDLRLQRFGEAVAEKFDGSYIEFHAKVRDVRWRDGIAEIDAVNELAQERTAGRIKITGGNPSVRLTRFAPIHLRMGQEAAASILPDTLITFRGRVKFHPANSPSPSAESQPLYSLEHTGLGGSVGRFTSSDYTGTIDGKTYAGRWDAMAGD